MIHKYNQSAAHTLYRTAALTLAVVFMSACSIVGGSDDSDDDGLIIGALAAVGASTLLNSAATSTIITLYSTGTTTGTAIGGRTGADSICTSNAPSGVTCTNFRAYLSVSSTDEIQDMPTNYSVPTNRTIQSSNGTTIATSWSDALDGSISTSLDSAGVFSTSSSTYWTGSSSTGAVAGTAGTCSNWNTGGVTGARGQSDQTDGDWIGLDENNGLGNFCGDTSVHLICICWTG